MGSFCCGGAAGWTKTVAYIQMSGSMLALSIYTVMLCRLQDVLNAVKRNHPNPERYNNDEAREVVLMYLNINTMLAVLSFGSGMFLLVGANERRPAFLNGWILLAISLTAVEIVTTTLQGELVGFINGGSIAQCIVLGLVNIFGIWVITLFKQKIRADSLNYEKEEGGGGRFKGK